MIAPTTTPTTDQATPHEPSVPLDGARVGQRTLPNGVSVKTGSVVSEDGTTIGYYEYGSGPAVVLLHGSMVSARSFSTLAEGLAERHTVFVPDRRGRGLSGPFRPDHSMQTELEDLEAVLSRSGARDIFAVSAGALVALREALRGPDLQRMALYEPALSVAGSLAPSLERLDRELADGDIAGALVTGMLETGQGPAAFRVTPRPILEALTAATMRSEEKKAGPGDVTMRQLAPTQHQDFELIAAMSDTLEDYRAITAEVLLMGGSKSPAWTRIALAALADTLPHATRIEFEGLDHGGATNPGPTARASDPARIAQEVRRFFG